MNLSPDLVQPLAKHGFEAVHWSSVGARSAIDQDILAWVKAHGFVLLSHDLDFSAILAATAEDAPSVVQLRMQNVLSEGALNAIVAALNKFRTELELGALLSIDESGTRVRLLPLRRF